MSEDPIRRLESFNDQGVDVNPLLASEVRRRGDRMRRRNNLLAAVGAVAAVAVIAMPLALVAAERDDTAPPPVLTEAPSPTEAPEQSWLTTIPQGFPLADGFPAIEGNVEFSLEEPSIDNQALHPAGSLTACETTPERGDPVDRLMTRLNGPAEVHERELQLFADDTAAAAYAASIREGYAGCPEESDGGPGTVTTVVSPMELGDDAFTAKRSYSGIGRVVVQVVRVGNAVLVNLDSDEGTDAEAMATENEQALGGAYDAMQVFSEGNRSAGRS